MLDAQGDEEGRSSPRSSPATRRPRIGVSIPAAIFTDPEIAVAGLTEEQAKAKGWR